MSAANPQQVPLAVVVTAMECAFYLSMLQQVAKLAGREIGDQDATLAVERFGREMVELALRVGEAEYTRQDQATQALGVALRLSVKAPLQ